MRVVQPGSLIAPLPIANTSLLKTNLKPNAEINQTVIIEMPRSDELPISFISASPISRRTDTVILPSADPMTNSVLKHPSVSLCPGSVVSFGKSSRESEGSDVELSKSVDYLSTQLVTVSLELQKVEKIQGTSNPALGFLGQSHLLSAFQRMQRKMGIRNKTFSTTVSMDLIQGQTSTPSDPPHRRISKFNSCSTLFIDSTLHTASLIATLKCVAYAIQIQIIYNEKNDEIHTEDILQEGKYPLSDTIKFNTATPSKEEIFSFLECCFVAAEVRAYFIQLLPHH